VTCPIVWRSTVHAPIADVADIRVDALDFARPSGRVPQRESVKEPADVDAVPDQPDAQLVAIWPAAAVGAIAACAYVLGRVTTAGHHVVAASMPVGIALLLACVVAAAVLRSAARPAGRPRLAAAIGIAVVFAAAVAAGAGALPHA
jgi:hypothetical protein